MSQPIKGIKIVSNGLPSGTKIFSNDGQDLTAALEVRSVQFKLDASGLCIASIDCFLSEVELTNITADLISKKAKL